MSRYARFRNFKYLAYPFFLERMVARAARETKFDLLFSQHAISAVAAGKLKRKLAVPVVMNFPDLLTGFMETWPACLAPKPLVRRSNATKFPCPCATAWTACWPFPTTLADWFAERGYPRERICRFITATTPKNFRSARSRRRKTRPLSSCTARSTRIISGQSRLTRSNL